MALKQDANKQVAQITARLNKRILAIKGNTYQGIYEAGAIIIREAAAHVPVEHGLLKASAFVRKSQSSETAVEIGFSQKYAAPLEVKDQKHAGDARPSGLGVFWGPDGHPHFLGLAIIDCWTAALDAVKKRAKI
jgi:hypothetical protein